MALPTPYDLASGFGSTTFPLRTDDPLTGEPLTAAGQLDRGKTVLLYLLRAAINADCGDAWQAIMSQEDGDSFLQEYAKLGIGLNPVMDIMTVQPSPQNLTQRKEAWPLLAVYREGEPTYDWKTSKIRRRTQQWGVDYIMAPLAADSQDRLGDIVVHVVDSIETTIMRGGHPAYNGGANPFYGIFNSLHVVSSTGPACSEVIDQKQGAGYFGGSVTLVSSELSVPLANAELDPRWANLGYFPTDYAGYGDALDAIPATVEPDIEGMGDDA